MTSWSSARTCTCVDGCVLFVWLRRQGGMYVLQLMDHYSAGFSVLVIAVTECLCINWFYGKPLPCTCTAHARSRYRSTACRSGDTSVFAVTRQLKINYNIVNMLPLTCHCFTALHHWYIPVWGCTLYMHCLYCITFAHRIGNDNLSKNIKEMTGKMPFIYWRLCWKFFSPIMIVVSDVMPSLPTTLLRCLYFVSFHWHILRSQFVCIFTLPCRNFSQMCLEINILYSTLGCKIRPTKSRFCNDLAKKCLRSKQIF